MVQRGSVRRYPRMARVNEVVREVIADELERLSDPRLGLVTVTGVDVSADLRHATVYYSALDPGREQPKRTRRRGARPVGAAPSDDARLTAPRMRRPSSRSRPARRCVPRHPTFAPRSVARFG